MPPLAILDGGNVMLRYAFAASVAVSLLLANSSGGGAGQADLKKELLRLNQVTGSDARAGALHELLANPEQTRQLLKAAATLAKNDKADDLGYNTAFLLGLAAAEMKDMPAAETFLRVCMNQAAKLQSVRRLLESYGSLYQLYFEQKQYDDAERVCRDLLDLKTDEGAGQIVYRAYTTRTGDTDFVEDGNFNSTKRLRPWMQQKLVRALAKQGKYDQALTLVDGLIKQQDHWQERELKGWVLREAGQFEKAAAIYEDVIRRISKDSDLETEEREDYAHVYRYQLSSLYIDLNDVDKAATQLQLLIQDRPEEPGYYNDLGYIWADHDMKLDEAEKLIRKALDLDRKRRQADPDYNAKTDRDNGAYLDSLGWVYFKQKKLPEAKETLQKALEDKSAQHIEIYDHLGDVLLALGERDGAVAAWRKGLDVAGEGRREKERRTQVERKLAKVK
jgi:tetratricopeptide (TPR) repeat protein